MADSAHFSFAAFGADPLGGRCPPRPPGSIFAKKKAQSAAALLAALLIGSSVSADVCTLSCDTKPACDTVTLEWEADGVLLYVDGNALEATRLEAGTRLDTIRSNGREIVLRNRCPMVQLRGGRKSGTVVLTKDETVTLTLIEMPLKYIEYEDAMRNRVVASGLCEGLF